MLHMSIPLIDDNGDLSGSMYKFIRMPRHIPRIGERIYLLPMKSVEVTDVSYDGPGIRSVSLTLEPLQQVFQRDLEAHSWKKSTSHPN